jgi:hypothetical protein
VRTFGNPAATAAAIPNSIRCLSQNVTFSHGSICMMMVMKRCFLIKVTEIVEVTEIITVLIENYDSKHEKHQQDEIPLESHFIDSQPPAESGHQH